MFSEYIEAALEKAVYKTIDEEFSRNIGKAGKINKSAFLPAE